MANEQQVILSHQQLVREVRERVTRYAELKWTRLGSYRDADIDRFVKEIVPLVESGRTQVGFLTNSYLDALARLAGLAPKAGKVPSYQEIRGLDADEVYRRLGPTTWTALSEGKPFDEAVKMGLYRLQDLIATDMQLAMTHTARGYAGDGIVGWRRVLSGAENCPLCAIASTQRYHRQELMPIHNGCDCQVAPIYGTSDPGQVINADRLDEIKGLLAEHDIEYSGGKFKTDRKIRIQEHGEHGPVLTWANQKFTGPNDL